MEIKQSEKAPRFYGVLRKYSQNTLDPVSEWEYVATAAGNGEGRCICSTPIFHEYVIQNKLSGQQLTIGSECIERWFHSALQCEKCKARIGNVSNRIRTHNYICGACNRQTKKKKKEMADYRVVLSQEHRNHYPQYHLKMFPDLIDDTEAVEILINLPPNNTLRRFEEYVALHYTVAETQVKIEN